MADTCPQPVMVSTTGSIGDCKIPLELIYDPSDPYAVVMIARDATKGSVPWVFARDLLDDGVVCRPDGHKAGEGDVLLCRTTYDVLTVTLRSPTGEVDIELSVDVVLDFLQASYEQVAQGDERSQVDWSVEIQHLQF